MSDVECMKRLGEDMQSSRRKRRRSREVLNDLEIFEMYRERQTKYKRISRERGFQAQFQQLFFDHQQQLQQLVFDQFQEMSKAHMLYFTTINRFL